ncbi:Putative ribonuclease H protein At1g65750 [Linum perenne]
MLQDELVNPRCPKILFSDDEVKQFYKPWSKALVVRVLENSFGYLALIRRPEYLWAKGGRIQVSDLSNDFFLVRFSDAEDYQRDAFHGPWKIYDYYITVARWTPNFNEEEPLRTILTWVRLPKLPIHYFNHIAVNRIGNHIGRTILVVRLGIPLTQDLGQYLGVPILHGRTTKETYQGIIDKLDQKLRGWKAKSFSLAGRVTLAQSALSAIPAYAMQTDVLPVTTCEAIDRRIRNFVWGSTSEERKMHLVSWDQICKPKALGGLGLRQAQHLNHAYMVKLAFKFIQSPDTLWVQVLQAKYFKESTSGLQTRKLASKLALWRGITKAWPAMLRDSRSGLRDGQNTSFWLGKWLDSGDKLIDLVTSPTDQLDLDAPVSRFVKESGEWDADKFRFSLPSETVLQILSLLPPIRGRGEDT